MNTRPDPDKLLALVQDEHSALGHVGGRLRGRLKIFFGASAGVGKTFAMLTEARRLHADGRDVVIGVVEHHGRAETLKLIEGLPVLPLKEIDHRGVKVKEFDIDAALTLKPSLILMDEYAHTNAGLGKEGGSRHPKRWQDVEELLDNGIDVFTTVNVQHLESLNDMVAKLTGVWVKETVPDSAFDAADDIALIDIPSDELLKRLHEGKVYVAEGANTRAAENFFKKTNLGRLRELALRRTAERVDAQNDALSAAMGQDETALGEKILVLIGADQLSGRLIRHAKRMADRARAPWSALYLQTGRHETLSDKARLRVEHNLRLSEKLGAKIVRLNAARVSTDIIAHARQGGFSRIVVGYSQPPWWRQIISLGQPSLSQKLITRAAGLEITTLSLDAGAIQEPRETPRWEPFVARPVHHGFAALIVAACTVIGLPFRELTDPDNLTMLYLTGIVIVAARLSIGPALLASVLSVAAFNWFFIKPYYSFTFDNISYLITFAVMLMTSLIVGSLTARLSLHARLARKGEAETRLLYDLTRELSSVRGHESMTKVAADLIAPAFKVEVAFYVRNPQGSMPSPADPRESGVVQWVAQNAQMAGRHTDTLPSARGLYLPVMAENEVLGVMGLTPSDEARTFTGAEMLLFETFASLIAGALQRARRADEAVQSRVESENEKLRNVLLASLSHDLRTPLTVMNNGVSTLLKMRKKLPREAVDELTSLWSHLTRLQKFVANLLRMAALTSGQMKLNFEPYGLPEIIGAVVSRLEPQKEGRQIRIQITGQLPMVLIDGALIEQVLINLLENAVAHTASDGVIILTAEKDADRVRVKISDNGEGLKAGEEALIFDSFQTSQSQSSDRKEGSTGLGLAICRHIVVAHGGLIYAKNNPKEQAGASFIFTLPVVRSL